MKKVFLLAYTNVNLGDDLFIYLICKRYPNLKFTIEYHENHLEYFREVNNIEVFKKPISERIYEKITKRRLPFTKNMQHIKKSDLTINIGGSIFMERKKWKQIAKDYQKKITNSKSFYILGSNFGPYFNSEYKETYENIFKNVNDICFRDNYSYELFSTSDNIRVAPDIIFSLPKYINVEKNIRLREAPYIVLSIIDLKSRKELSEYTEQYITFLTKLVKLLIEKQYKVVLMSFCRKEGDLNAINGVLDRLGLDDEIENNVEVYSYEGNIRESLNIIKNSNGILATRFHATILGLTFGIPTLPVIYSKKTTNMLNDINFKGERISLDNLNQIDLNKVIFQLGNKENIDISSLSEQSEMHFKKLDKTIKY